MDNIDKTPATEESVWAALREIARRQEETDRQMKDMNKTIGSLANNLGAFAEEYFFRW